MRNKRLDILRCVAVLLVIFCHANPPGPLALGWVGVDLFFVLSGFLISGLLFKEYLERGAINFKRFWMRRGLKIFPSFYVMLGATLLYQTIFHQLSGIGRYASEIFYMQNYGGAIWGHTWSLAVEEHFYILLPIYLLLLIRRSQGATDPFKPLPLSFLIVAVVCLALRLSTVARFSTEQLTQWNNYRWAYATTHCRIDSLFFGVLLGYLSYFRSAFLELLFDSSKRRLLLAAIAAVLLAPAFIFPLQSRFMLTFGVVGLYLGFGIVLLLTLSFRWKHASSINSPLVWLGNALAHVGMYSYSIYLWHLPVQSWGSSLLRRNMHIPSTSAASTTTYICASILFGVLMSRMVEYPVLKLRDRIFPR